MTREIDARTLQDWLTQKKPVSVLDIRQEHDRQQWWIPESLHVDAYDSLKAGDPGPLATLSLPDDRPVVTVCGSGRVSLKAAGILVRCAGFPRLLPGGMRA
jgi:rhodanese-related sulfurtransferase